MTHYISPLRICCSIKADAEQKVNVSSWRQIGLNNGLNSDMELPVKRLAKN
jgi:hypothetical protein